MVYQGLYLRGKYGYTPNEKILSFLVNGLSNFTSLPTVIYLFRRGDYFMSFLVAFTSFTSFFYHLIESMNTPDFFLTDI